MRILHYSLGFPPYRTGGLTKFCMDLMEQQVKDGQEVSLLWPGEMRLINKRTKIRNNKSVDGIKSFEVINPTPISFDEGIKDFDLFMCSGDIETYKLFLDNLKPDVIHVHTLMGLHKSLLDVAKNRGVRLVFTTHDFFPICPKVTMFRHGNVCKCVDSCEECGVCNNTALSLGKIQILQSPLYRSIKNSKIVKRLRKQHRDNYLSDTAENLDIVGTPEDYRKLRNFYYSMLKLMDVVHYNSSVTKEAYERVFDLANYRVISISHSDIKDNRRKKDYDSSIIRLRYLGPQSAAKGYYFLIKTLNDLWNIRQDFRLDVHFKPTDIPPYIVCHERYGHDQLEKIFNDTDVLVCPSIWYETFGYTVLEALSYGVPVIISDHVGAKDVICNGCGFVAKKDSENSLFQILTSITPDKLENMNRIILENQNIITIQEMSDRLNRECYMEG